MNVLVFGNVVEQPCPGNMVFRKRAAVDTSYRDQTTLDLDKTGTKGGVPRAIGVTILFHPDVGRIGEVAPLIDQGSRVLEICFTCLYAKFTYND